MTSKSYRAVFFDAGGTLFKPHPSVGEIYARVARPHGMTVDAEKLEKRFREEFSKRDKHVSLKAHSSEKNEREWWKNLVKDVFKEFTPLRNFDRFFDELYDLFARAKVWKLDSEAIPLLRKLRARKLVIGIVSNWDSRLFSICEGMDVKKYFDFILASAVVGFAKPDVKIFEEALRLANAKPSEALHIGDSVENDFFGARHAGIDALLINRNGYPVDNVTSICSLNDVTHYI